MLHCLESAQVCLPQMSFPGSAPSCLLQQHLQAPLSPVARREGNAESQASPDVNQAADDKPTISICAIDTKQKVYSLIQQLKSKTSLSTPGSPLQRSSHRCRPCSRALGLLCPQPLSRVTFGPGWNTVSKTRGKINRGERAIPACAHLCISYRTHCSTLHVYQV